MVSLEQVKLLETKVAKVIEHVELITGENNFLKAKLGDYEKRIDELEVLIQRFREEQNRIEEEILATLNRLNQFEGAAPAAPLRREHPAPAAGGEPLPESGVPVDEETNAPAEDEAEESDEDIIFASGAQDEDSLSADGDDPAQDGASSNPSELDIF